MTNPYTPPQTYDDHRRDWPVFPFGELATNAVLGRSVYLFVFVSTEAGTMCLIPAVLLAMD